MYGLFARVSFGARLDPSSSIHSGVICDIVSLSFNDGCGEGGRLSGDFPGSVALYSMFGFVEGSWTGWCCLCRVLECSALFLASSLFGGALWGMHWDWARSLLYFLDCGSFMGYFRLFAGFVCRFCCCRMCYVLFLRMRDGFWRVS